MNILEQIEQKGKSGLATVIMFAKESAFDPLRAGTLQDLADHGVSSVKDVSVGKLFVFEGLSQEQAVSLEKNLLVEETHQIGAVDGLPAHLKKGDYVFAVSFLPGVTNPEVESLKYAAGHLKITLEKVLIAKVFVFHGSVSEKDRALIASVLMNKTVEYELVQLPETLALGASKEMKVENVKLTTGLAQISADRSLFLSLEEMKAIQEYYLQLGRDPTDCELEVIAQVWSEHCGHKTFKANVVMNGEQKIPFFTRIKNVTKAIAHPDVWSAFHDNAGVVAFEGDTGLCLKAETHNAPSAIEPFGGAETGVGGVIRDILGTGRGAKAISVFDVLCFGNPQTLAAHVPRGCLHPEVTFRKVVAGIQSYGNKIGLPNISGALFFDDCYLPKPVVLAGCIGLIRRDMVDKMPPRDGDVLLSIGGKTGRDGIHGATFSSGAMESSTKDVQSQAVQIGFPALEKRLMDVLEILRDRGYIRTMTDCGAGGLSSAVTEMAQDIGAEIDLKNVSLKYQGLQPWEILLSESQERMVLGVAPEDGETVKALCERYGITADIIGKFSDNGKMLRVNYGDMKVTDLSLDFLFTKNPTQTITGKFDAVQFDSAAIPELSSDGLRDTIHKTLSHLNVCSREPIVRQYDHYVRTGNYSSYFEGRHRDTPQDAMVFKPVLDSDRGFSVAHGMCPNTSFIDPYHGAISATVEALSNLLSRGVDLKKVFLMDNFIHAKPDNEIDIGTLDRSVDGVCDAATAFGAPFVSGKDSLGGTFKGDNGVIKVKPTLCVTAVGIIPDVKKSLPNHFQKSGNRLFFVGNVDFLQLGGSVFSQIRKLSTNNVPRVDVEKTKLVFGALSAAMADGCVISCHDVSDGGMVTTLAEMSMGENLGCEISLDQLHFAPTVGILFHETPGCFVIEVSREFDPSKYGVNGNIFEIGHIRKDDTFIIMKHATALFNTSVGELRNWIKNPLFEKYFPVGSRNLQIEESLSHDSSSPRAFATLSKKPRTLVLRAPGINSEEETRYSFDLAGADARIVDIVDVTEKDFEESQILAIPGGFSYADDLSSGKIFAADLIYRFEESLKKFAESEKLVVGICNGFQVLVRTGLLPLRNIGSLESNLVHNTHGFFCRKIRMEIVPSKCVWTNNLEEMIFSAPVAHGEGRFMTKNPAMMERLIRDQQIVFRYINDEREATMTFPYNPNGSTHAIAGICDPSGRILGMMPHPERDARNVVKGVFSSFVGMEILKNGLKYFEQF
ncbi:MAG: phosphoribosylformylglycinamidine synthase subunit PurL [Patescibacteria group bacterium]